MSTSERSGEYGEYKLTPVEPDMFITIRKGIACRWVQILSGCNPIFLYYKELDFAILTDLDVNIVIIRYNLLNLPQKVQFRNRSTNEYSTMLQA